MPFRRFVESPRESFGLGRAYDPELPKEVDENLDQAARHVSFRLMGGAIFFWLRAAEGMLQYYCKLMVEDENTSVNVPWGRLCDLLNRDDCETPSHLVKEIEQLKDNYRDPVAHVTEQEIELDEETALNVLTRCHALIENMMQHLEETDRVTVLTGLPSELEFPEE